MFPLTQVGQSAGGVPQHQTGQMEHQGLAAESFTSTLLTTQALGPVGEEEGGLVGLVS